MAQEVMEKHKKEREEATVFFSENVKPKIEEKLQEMAKQLRWTLQVNAGESTESIQEGNENAETTLSKEPLHQQVMKMRSQIVQVKVILKKSKDLKEELKYDIHSTNVEIDKLVEKIG